MTTQAESGGGSRHEQGDHGGQSAVLSDGGGAGSLVRSFDWSRTPLGPIASWSSSLRNVVGMLLHSKHPMFLWWGPELIQVYNDAYVPSFGKGKHPRAMGQAGRECWGEIWPIIWPQIDDVMRFGHASWNEDQLVPIFRNGRLEDVYWTYGYSPVFDDDGAIGGTLVVCTETTPRVVSERRLRTLRALSDKMAFAATPEDVLDEAFAVLTRGTADVPFALLYAVDRETGEARMTHAAGLDDELRGALGERFRHVPVDARPTPLVAGSPTPIGVAARGSDGREVTEVVVASLGSAAAPGERGYVVFGLNPRLSFDEAYADYFSQIGQQLAQASARAEVRRVRAVTEVEREKLLAELEAASQAKDEFLAMLGHELRNPISPIMTAVQLLKLRGGGVVTREVEVIDRQTQHLTRLVDDLLDVSRIARGKVVLERSAVEIADVIAAAIETVSPVIELGRHRLVVKVAAHGLVVDADRSRLGQVFANLLTNAARYTPAEGTIAVTTTREGAEVVTRVADTGIGLAADLLPRVFDLFVQARQTLARDQGGLGLGLAIVKNLVGLHGGSVSAESAGPGKGSTFSVRLPALEGSAEDLTASPAPRQTSEWPGARVLVVDDNVDAAELLAEALAEVGYRTCVAHDGAEAIDLAERFAPQIAVLDIGLPVMDGYELVSRLRERFADLVAIALTGYGQKADRERTRAAGFHAHLTKPVDLENLVGVLGGIHARA